MLRSEQKGRSQKQCTADKSRATGQHASKQAKSAAKAHKLVRPNTAGRGHLCDHGPQRATGTRADPSSEFQQIADLAQRCELNAERAGFFVFL
ncbi:hypothetical protein LBMAG49_19210 [Planctomycetota bacterium]|nr:hypothetical protein LBMAG49_19210 [Planctomycetota bacterium]